MQRAQTRLEQCRNKYGNITICNGKPPDGLTWIGEPSIHWAAIEVDVPYLKAQVGHAWWRGRYRPKTKGIVISEAHARRVLNAWADRQMRKDSTARKRKAGRLAKFRKALARDLPHCPPETIERIADWYSSRYSRRLVSLPGHYSQPAPESVALYFLQDETEAALRVIDPEFTGLEEGDRAECFAQVSDWIDGGEGYECNPSILDIPDLGRA